MSKSMLEVSAKDLAEASHKALKACNEGPEDLRTYEAFSSLREALGLRATVSDLEGRLICAMLRDFIRRGY